MGKTVYVCPDCDGYEVNNRRVLVIGSGKAGANLSLVLTYWTNDITYINHDKKDIGLVDKVSSPLIKNGYEVDVYADTAPEPPLALGEKLVSYAKKPKV